MDDGTAPDNEAEDETPEAVKKKAVMLSATSAYMTVLEDLNSEVPFGNLAWHRDAPLSRIDKYAAIAEINPSGTWA